MPTSDFLREATERGFVFQCTDLEGLDDALRSGQVSVNGAVETQPGRKLFPGDRFSAEGGDEWAVSR